MASINWNDGRLIELEQGDTASCLGGLNAGQIYALFFYNAAQNEAATNVQVVWSNSQAPVSVSVPGTTQKQGLAALCFVSGNDTSTISAAVNQAQPGAKIQAFIGSVKMPINTAGITNRQLPLDGHVYPFQHFTRFYTVPQSHWYSGQITSDINQFTSVQFTESKARVSIVNKLVDPSNVIKFAGNCEQDVTIEAVDHQTLAWNFQGNGSQTVWINADSIQNSKSATIAVQSLAAVMSQAELAAPVAAY